MKRTVFISLFIGFFIFHGHLFSQGIVINEMMSNNYLNVLDFEGEDSDWIELFNNSSDTINLSGYYLSDDVSNLSKWELQDIEILPYSFLVVFASGKDTVFSNNEIHCNFLISVFGESLYLMKDNQILSNMNTIKMEQNQSFGYFPDGVGEPKIFDFASPGLPNSNIEKEKVKFSHSGGFYSSVFTLSLSNINSEYKIFYAIDGDIPNTSSIKYLNGIVLNSSACSPIDIYKVQMSPEEYMYIPESPFSKAITIRAASFDSIGNMMSDVATKTFIIGEMGISQSDLPILSITADYDALFDDSIGIFVPGIYHMPDSSDWTGNYYQRGDNWEREANVELYEPDNSCIFNYRFGLRTHGGNIRRFPQKGMRFYARGIYGTKTINAKVFPDAELCKYNSLVLKPFSSSWTMLGYEDYLACELAKNLKCDYLNTRPVCVYLNGEYWGIYFLQERADEHFVEDNFGADLECTDVIENWFGSTVYGDNSEFIQLFNYIDEHDLQVNDSYYEVTQELDINNFIDYNILELFIANYDWAANNMKCWRDQSNGKWRWIFVDGDAGFSDSDFDAFEHATNESEDYWPTNKYSTLFFRKLMQNKNFFMSFVARFEELSETVFNIESTESYLRNISADIGRELPNQSNRFNTPPSIQEWTNAFNEAENFLIYRMCDMQDHFENKYDYLLNIANCDNPQVSLKTFEIYPNPAKDYFNLMIELDYKGPFNIIIRDLSGRNIISYSEILLNDESLFSFDISQLKNGIYLVTCVISTKTFTKRLVVLK